MGCAKSNSCKYVKPCTDCCSRLCIFSGVAILGIISTDKVIPSPDLVMSSILADGSVLSVEVPPNDEIAVVTLPCVRIFN